MQYRKYLRSIIEIIYKLPTLKKPLPNNPFGKSIIASKYKYLNLHKLALRQNDQKVIKFEKNCGYSINRTWFNNLALHTQVVIKKEEINFFHGRLLYSLLSKYINEKKLKEKDLEPLLIFETGTARGFSSICMAKALNDNNFPGCITTLDCIPHQKKIYWNCIDDHDGPKSREELLMKWENELKKIIFIQGWTDEILASLGMLRINFAFLDAQHTKEDVLKEFKFVSKRQLNGDIVVFDDVTFDAFPGVCEAIDFIQKNYDYKIEKIKFTEKRGYAIATKLSK